MLLIAFAFLAGVVTILSPCILPLLPIILSSSLGSSRARPLGVVTGFVLSFTFATLFLSSLVSALGISADSLRSFSIIVLVIFGLTLLVPRIQYYFEILASRLASRAPTVSRTDFFGGVIVGLSLGLLWTPCVGPILASVISLALTGSVNSTSIFITLAYALGTAIPMLLIMLLGARALNLPSIVKYSSLIQRVFGVIMILTALAIYSGLDRSFQSYILDRFPSYGANLTSIEDNAAVRSELTEMSDAQSVNPSSTSAPELLTGGEWFNLPDSVGTPPLTLASLRGKVVLIDFWTYSCINCQRTLPYLKSWWTKYSDQGLVIIGVHAPEFEFEKDPENVKEAIADFGIEYPVMQDNNFATWKAYRNRYWPAKYLIDKEGVVRYTHFGEGKYDETETKIQQLLKEAGAASLPDVSNPPPAPNRARTHETYLGSDRRAYNPDLIFNGDWSYTGEYARPTEGGSLTYSFVASDIFLVMRPSRGVGHVKVYIDDKYVQTIAVDSDTLYPLATDLDPSPHTLRLEFETDNLELYAFTFG